MAQLKNPDNWKWGIKRVWPDPRIQNWTDYCPYRFRCKNWIEHCSHCKYAMDNFFEPMNKSETMQALEKEK